MELTSEVLRDLAVSFRALAGKIEALVDDPEPAGDRDLSVAEVAEKLGRSASTVRDWLGQRRFPGAYRLPGAPGHAAWRVPGASLERFRVAQRGGGQNLGAWRKHRKASVA